MIMFHYIRAFLSDFRRTLIRKNLCPIVWVKWFIYKLRKKLKNKNDFRSGL